MTGGAHIKSGIRAQVAYLEEEPLTLTVNGTPGNGSIILTSPALGANYLYSFLDNDNIWAGAYLWKVGGSQLYLVTGSTSQVSVEGTPVRDLKLELDDYTDIDDGDTIILYAPGVDADLFDVAYGSGGTGGDFTITNASVGADSFVNKVNQHLGYVDETDLPEPEYGQEDYWATGGNMPQRKGVLDNAIKFQRDLSIGPIYDALQLFMGMGGCIDQASSLTTRSTLDGDTVPGQRYVVVHSNTGYANGMYVQVGDSLEAADFASDTISSQIVPTYAARQTGPEIARILYINGTTIWLDRALRRAHSNDETVKQVGDGYITHWIFAPIGLIPSYTLEATWKGFIAADDEIVHYMGVHAPSIKVAMGLDTPIVAGLGVYGMGAESFEKGDATDLYHNLYSVATEYEKGVVSEPAVGFSSAPLTMGRGEPIQWRHAAVEFKIWTSIGSSDYETFWYDRIESVEVNSERNAEEIRGLRRYRSRTPTDIVFGRANFTGSIEIPVVDDRWWKAAKAGIKTNMIEVTFTRGISTNDSMTIVLRNVAFPQIPYRIPPGVPLKVTADYTAEDVVFRFIEDVIAPAGATTPNGRFYY